MLPACDLQAVLPQSLQLPAYVRQTHVLQRRSLLCAQVRTGCGPLCRSRSDELCCPRDVRSGARLCSGSGARLRSGSGDVCLPRSGALLSGASVSGSGDVCCSRSVCPGALRRSGPGDVCLSRSVCRSGPGFLRCSCDVRSGARPVRCSGASSGQVLRQPELRQQHQVLQCRSVRSRALDL